MTSYLPTSVIAQRLGVDAEKIRRWIESGQLVGVNLAEDLGGRPRWKVSEEELAKFLDRRASRPKPKVVKRRRDVGVIEFY